MTNRFTTDDGCGISFSDEGRSDAPPVLLANSLGTTQMVWDRVAAQLTSQFRVVRFDNRGHGGSDVPAGDYTIERLGRDAIALLDHLGITRAHVAGISIGGQIALWMAAHAPEKLRGAALFNTGARIQDENFWNQRMTLVRAQGVEAVADGAIARWFTAAFKDREPETFAAFRDALLHTPRDGYLGCCAALRDADLRAAAASVCLPTIVVAGRHDQSTPPSLSYALRDAIPHSALHELDAAHLSPVERAPEAVELLRNFVEASL